MRKKYTPRDYQLIMTEYMLLNKRCGVWAEMGLGKTVATLTALDIIFALGEEEPPALVLAPLRVAATTWPDEADKWEHLKKLHIQPIIGSAAERRVALRTKADVYTINYENIVWLVEYLGDKWPFKVLIADESTKLKSFRTRQGGKRAHALAYVSQRFSTRFIELTGTPASNGLKDLWGQVWFLDEGQRLCRTYGAFKTRFFNEDRQHFRLDLKKGADEEIREKVKDICKSLRAADYFDIKEPIVIPRYVELPPAVRVKYDEMEELMFTEIKDVIKGENHAIEAVNAAARTMKCLQFASGATYLNGDNKEYAEVHDMKIQALEEIIEEANGMPVLVAYHFKSDLQRLLKAFPKARHLDDKPATIKQWNDGKIPILLAHPASAGHGLNLQDGGNILVYFSHNWNLEERDQILGRIGPTRQLQSGHNRPVFVYNIIAKDTVDGLVLKRLKGKSTIQEILMDAMKHKQEKL